MRHKFSRFDLSESLNLSIPESESLSPTLSHIVQTILTQCKDLENELHRFNSKKYNSHKGSRVLKSNLLRTSLIPFLRGANLLNLHIDPQDHIFHSLLDVELSLLSKWWTLLLYNLNCKHVAMTVAAAALQTSLGLKIKKNVKSRLISFANDSSIDDFHDAPLHCSPIPMSDRNAYMECISRIISRSDWIYADAIFKKRYLSLLTTTMEFCIERMTNLKAYSVANAAFAGKVFAYNMFATPHVGDAILFLLNVRQSTLEKTKAALNFSAPDSFKDSFKQRLCDIFPPHLHHLINYNGLDETNLLKLKTSLNCLATPNHPIPGIRDPNSGWVNRWCTSNSNVFNSFFKHYMDNLHRTLALAPRLWHQDSDIHKHELLFMSPGFVIVHAHVFDTFLMSLLCMANGPMQKPSPILQPVSACRLSAGLSLPLNYNSENTFSNTSMLFGDKGFTMYHASIIKHFSTVRYIVYNICHNPTLSGIFTALLKAIDRSLQSLARTISIHDHLQTGIILSLTLELFNHVTETSPQVMLSFDWEFWLNTLYIMLSKADHVQVLLTAFSFLFNIWDHIPEQPCCDLDKINSLNHWLTDLTKSLRHNFILWLISDKVFIQFFSHWNPTVRSYYMRLAIWRIVGANNSGSIESVSMTQLLQKKLDNLYDALVSEKFQTREFHDSMAADCPFVNRLISVLPTCSKEDIPLQANDVALSESIRRKSNDLRRTNPYEIFDEAVYTCASALVMPVVCNLSHDEDQESLSRQLKLGSRSLSSTLSKWFKYWSPNDGKEAVNPCLNFQLSKAAFPKSLSLNRLSNSSSPSLSSFGSRPTSRSFSTAASSLCSDVDTEVAVSSLRAIENTHMPPGVPRPLYKFEIVFDNDSIQKKHLLISWKNNEIYYSKNFSNRTDGRNDSKMHAPKPQDSCFPEKVSIPILLENSILRLESQQDCAGDKDSQSLCGAEFSQRVPGRNVNRCHTKEPMALFIADHYKLTVQGKEAFWVRIGRGLNEFNLLLSEFITHIHHHIELDLFSSHSIIQSNNLKENLRWIYPHLAVDCSTDLRLLNAL